MKVLKWIGIVLLLALAGAYVLYLIYVRPFTQKMKETSTVQYDKELTIVLGGGGNSGILVSDSLVIVIDTKMGEAAEQLYKKVKELAGTKHILVINTHAHPDHTEGNKLYKGATIIAGGSYTKDFWKGEAGEDAMPTEWLKAKMDIQLGDDTVTVLNMAKNIHTASDIVVYLHKRKMLFAGDIILNKQCPVLMGIADPDAYMAAFDQLPKLFDIQKIVPGHGAIGGTEIIDSFRQYFTDMRAAAIDGTKKDELTAKYKDWGQIPVFMSPNATVSFIGNKIRNPQ